MAKFLLSLLLTLSLVSAEDAWYSRVDVQAEVGIYLPTLSGNIENIAGVSHFSEDIGYTKTKSSYFSLTLRHDYNYLPNVSLSYFNMKESKSTKLTKAIKIANQDFNSSIKSDTNYQVFNATIYQDLFIEGELFTLFGTKYYSGDLEFNIGLSLKLFDWHYTIQNLEDLTQAPSWINTKALIPLPYLGVKYFLYDLTIYAEAEDLAFFDAKANTYQAGIDYRITSGLDLGVAYIAEEFRVIEEFDTVNFKTSGYKFSFKYSF